MSRIYTHPATGEIVDDPQIKPFADWLAQQAGGKTHRELSETLWDLVQRVTETAKKGTLTLALTVEIKDGLLIVSDQIKTKMPEFTRPASVYWPDDNGNLSARNPNQPELTGLREVTADTRPIGVRHA